MFKMFGSVRLVQEVTRSNRSSPSSSSLNAEIQVQTKQAQQDEQEQHSSITEPVSTVAIKPTATATATSPNTTANTAVTIEANNQVSNPENMYIQLPQTQPLNTSSTLSPLLSPSTKHIPKTQKLAKTNTNKPNYTTFRNIFLDLSSKPRKTSQKYTVRHYRTRQPSLTTNNNYIPRPASSAFGRKQHASVPSKIKVLKEEKKSKSQKLLCLWPLPIITRYMILLAFIISGLNTMGILELKCVAPSFVIYRWDFKNLTFSPFLFDFTLQDLFLFGWNVLIMGLFEESLAHTVGGTRRFIVLLLSLFALVSSIRIALGYLFSKSTGWALPILFFSNSMHECNKGLAPFLFALLIVQSLSIEDKYILIYGQEDDNKLTVRKVTLQLLMCLINYSTKNILWWSITGVGTGFLATIVLQTILAREKREDSFKVKDVNDFITLEEYRRTPLWRLVWSSMKKGALVVIVTMSILMTFNCYYTQETRVTATQLNSFSADRYLFTFVFMTAPRRGDPAYLSRTIESYLANWPENPSPDSPYNRIQAIIYTHFTNHSQFDAAMSHFSHTPKGQRYLKWVREDGNELNQRLHVSKALDLATREYPSTYYALMEDDFPVCGKREWHEIENVIYKADQSVPEHCGVFVGTGGSGLFLKPEITRLASQLLLKYSDMPPDIIIQNCLTGRLDECTNCQDKLVTSKRLLMYHIGYNTSTSSDRIYRKDEFQCGWRHPFNGDPSAITL